MKTPKVFYHVDQEVYTCELQQCPRCQQPLVECGYQGAFKTVQTLPQVLRIAQRPKWCVNLECAGQGQVLRSAHWQQIAPRGCTYGYDVIAQIGWERQEHRQQFAGIRGGLQPRVQISESEVRSLYHERYLALIACQERLRREEVEKAAEARGLLIALDGLAPEGGEPQLWMVRELQTGMVLRCGWLSKQDTTAFEHFLAPVAAAEWPVVAVLSDKQRGLEPAVAAVFPKAAHALCQVHYLRNAAAPVAEACEAMKVRLRKEVRERVGALIRQEQGAGAAGVLTVTGLLPSPLAAEGAAVAPLAVLEPGGGGVGAGGEEPEASGLTPEQADGVWNGVPTTVAAAAGGSVHAGVEAELLGCPLSPQDAGAAAEPAREGEDEGVAAAEPAREGEDEGVAGAAGEPVMEAVTTAGATLPGGVPGPAGAGVAAEGGVDGAQGERERIVQDMLRRVRYLLTLKARPPFGLAGLEMFRRLRELLACLATLIAHDPEPRLVHLHAGLEAALSQVGEEYEELRQAAEWLQRIAAILDPQSEPERSGAAVRWQLLSYLDEIEAQSRGSPRLSGYFATIHKVTLSYAPGLFHSYDIADLPRTNNRCEGDFRDLTRRLGCTTGQKGLTRRLLQREGAWELLGHPETLAETVKGIAQIPQAEAEAERERVRGHRGRFRLHVRSAKQAQGQLEDLARRWTAIPASSAS
jgi:hypothetical protein